MPGRRPLVGVMCCNEQSTRPIQAVATRFIRPLADVADASVLLVPAVADAVDVPSLAQTLDGLLLTGSRSNVAPHRYGDTVTDAADAIDDERDEVALRLAGAMVERGRPVFGICRGMQEINVLFGGTLAAAGVGDHHFRGSWDGDAAAMFSHRHDVLLTDGGLLHRSTGRRRIVVNSVHEQGVARLGTGLAVEAVATGGGLVEAVATQAGDAPVLAVQWHPECDLTAPAGTGFFSLFGASLRGASIHGSTTRGLQ